MTKSRYEQLNLVGKVPASDLVSLISDPVSRISGSNKIINGLMQVWQRGVSFPAAAPSIFTADRWRYFRSGEMVHTISQSSDVPTVAQAGIKILNSLKLQCTTVDASITAAQYCAMSHNVEGYSIQDLVNKPVTLSFWVKSAKVGTFCVSLYNNASNPSYIAEYTINVANTWEKKVVSLQFHDCLTGAWNFSNLIGISLWFSLAMGSDFYGTKDTWANSAKYCTANQVNACDSLTNDFYITGVKLERGSVATQLEVPDYQDELLRCYRYYQVLDSERGTLGNGQGWSSNNGYVIIPLKSRMRATPTYSFSAATDWGCVAPNGASLVVTGMSMFANGPDSLYVDFTVASGLVAGSGTFFYARNGSVSKIFVNCEL